MRPLRTLHVVLVCLTVLLVKLPERAMEFYELALRLEIARSLRELKPSLEIDPTSGKERL